MTRLMVAILASTITRHLDPEAVACELERMAGGGHGQAAAYRACAGRIRKDAADRVALEDEMERMAEEKRSQETEEAAA